MPTRYLDALDDVELIVLEIPGGRGDVSFPI